MRVISKKTLRVFWERHPDSRGRLEQWLRAVRIAAWNEPNDVKGSFRSADLLPGQRAVFDIGGNDYRIVARIDCEYRLVFIRFVGTHAQYDRIDARTI